MGYYTRHKIGNGSSKYDHYPDKFEEDLRKTKKLVDQFENDFMNLLNKDYEIEKHAGVVRRIDLEEKKDIIVKILYDLLKDK